MANPAPARQPNIAKVQPAIALLPGRNNCQAAQTPKSRLTPRNRSNARKRTGGLRDSVSDFPSDFQPFARLRLDDFQPGMAGLELPGEPQPRRLVAVRQQE
jgi:hypothetical protein